MAERYVWKCECSSEVWIENKNSSASCIISYVFRYYICPGSGQFRRNSINTVRYIQMQALNVDIHNLLSDSHGPLPLPYAQIAYVFDRELVDVGLGYKAWVIGPMLLFPIAFADITIAKILHVEASMGGLLMTVVEGSKPAWLLPIPLLVSEFGMYIKVYETFQTGISCLVPAYIADKLYFSCVVCVALRFVLDDF